jgi:rare lipoprotein A
MTRAYFSVIFLSLVAAACGKKKVKSARGRPSPRPPGPAAQAVVGATETGIASWYGHPYHGRPAADGEIYDMETLVAAHRTLPFNTWVRVTNLTNSKIVDVRIIDRGPFIDGRIIDLSHAAAKAVDLIGPGIAQVRIEVIVPPRNPEAPVFGVQVGLFAFRGNADRVMHDMQARYGPAQVIARHGLSTTWRVVAGRESSPEDAEALAVRIRAAENFPEAFVVRVDQ